MIPGSENGSRDWIFVSVNLAVRRVLKSSNLLQIKLIVGKWRTKVCVSLKL